jgi:hypothetical protein
LAVVDQVIVTMVVAVGQADTVVLTIQRHLVAEHHQNHH